MKNKGKIAFISMALLLFTFITTTTISYANEDLLGKLKQWILLKTQVSEQAALLQLEKDLNTEQQKLKSDLINFIDIETYKAEEDYQQYIEAESNKYKNLISKEANRIIQQGQWDEDDRVSLENQLNQVIESMVSELEEAKSQK
ncbi:hypothetical protein [Peribacillus alkalitolerans]|uniref:hypothetical protein n=1 Tax=Peribacillus alkalitolerans TaxID=1550385 RepID=UPI0013D1234D|nr:hypothetical protein [Peribacillus alkalitolerans]